MTSSLFAARRAAVALALTFGLAAAHAQTAASAPAASPSSPAKRDLAKRMLVLQQPGFDALARSLAERPAAQLLSQVGPVLNANVPADKRDQVGKQIQDEARKYADEINPIVRKRMQELTQSQVLPALEEKYTEDELRQIVAFFESPAYKKMQQVQPAIDQALQQKLVTDMQPAIETRARALQASIAKLLGLPPPNAVSGGAPSGGGGSGLKPPAPKPGAGAASKP